MINLSLLFSNLVRAPPGFEKQTNRVKNKGAVEDTSDALEPLAEGEVGTVTREVLFSFIFLFVCFQHTCEQSPVESE